jgi:dTDP-glucose 4,6-dehydratase
VSGRLLVTGGSGFIGSAFVRAVTADGARVANLDAGTYAADERRLAQTPAGAVETVRADIREDRLSELVAREQPAAIVHFAAESHVTRSETAADEFFAVNVEGTRRVLEAALAAGVPRVLHVSTDEVYGPCPGAPFREQDKLAGEGLATSAYARSKALADDLALEYATVGDPGASRRAAAGVGRRSPGPRLDVRGRRRRRHPDRPRARPAW